MHLIEFHGAAHAIERFPHPYPASRAVPEWFKRVPSDEAGRWDQPTLKRCPPFLEAMTCGYIVPLACGVRIEMDAAGRIACTSTGPVATQELISAHPPEQVRGTPLEGRVVLKFHNPWIVRTPPGYAALFAPPLNRFEWPLTFFSGVVETDAWYRAVHFPFVCHLRPGQRLEMAAGAPLMQVIPIAREPWRGQVVPRDDARYEAIGAEMAAELHVYREKYWAKREYA
jgi:hypothetical protein